MACEYSIVLNIRFASVVSDIPNICITTGNSIIQYTPLHMDIYASLTNKIFALPSMHSRSKQT